MKNSYFSVQGEILWLAHYDVTIRIYLCCPYFGETVRRGEGLLNTHRTISRLGMGRASNRFIALSKWIFAVKYFMGEVYNPPSNTLTSAQNTSLDWKTILADKLMVNDSEFGGINYDLSVVLWCPPPPSPSTTGENFPLIPEQHEAGPGQGRARHGNIISNLKLHLLHNSEHPGAGRHWLTGDSAGMATTGTFRHCALWWQKIWLKKCHSFTKKA